MSLCDRCRFTTGTSECFECEAHGYDHYEEADDFEYEVENTLPKRFLVQRIADDGERMEDSIMSGGELIKYINFNDIYGERYEIFDITEFGKFERVWYAGWRPNCLIEIVDKNRKVVYYGYGEDH